MATECVTHQAAVTFERLNRDAASEALIEVHSRMSPTARYMRYLSATPRLTTSMLQVLSDIDGRRHIAWSANCRDRVVGLVRLQEDREGDPELAVEVADDHTGQGIGSALVSIAIANASARGTRAIRILVHRENTRAIRLFKARDARFSFEAGALEGTIPVTPSRLVVA